ncbi:MAG: TIR domain-containing protein [Planctomycetales bacterium]
MFSELTAGMSTLFISYKTEDREIAHEVRARLIERKFEQPFIDSESLVPGQPWEPELYRRLRFCKGLIILCSEHWLTSQFCFTELGYALALGKPVFPVQIGQCAIPLVLQRFQAIRSLPDGDIDYSGLWKGLSAAGIEAFDAFDWNPQACPYPGLEFFSEEQAGVYFGRSEETQGVLDALRQLRNRDQPRLLLITGASGSGKSSLARAGVAPRLRHKSGGEWIVPPVFRWNELRPAGLKWHERLARDLVSVFPPDAPRPALPEVERLLTPADDSDLGVVVEAVLDLTRRLLDAGGVRTQTPLLVIDQLEELLVAGADPEQEQFLEFLERLLDDRRSAWLALATVRTDSLAMGRAQRLLTALNPHEFLLPLMHESRLAEVIREPAAMCGIEFDSDALVNEMVRETQTNDALPLLALTLREMFDKLGPERQFTQDLYDRGVGRIAGSLRRVVAELVDQTRSRRNATDGVSSDAPDATIPLLRRCFVQLAQVNERDQFVRSPAKLAAMPPEALGLLRLFENKRLVTIRGEGEEAEIEVTHEALFRVWGDLAGWLEESRTQLIALRQLRETASAWGAHDYGDSYLYQGERLAQLLEWKTRFEWSLGPLERTFLQSSVQTQNEEHRAEAARHERELAQARKLVEIVEARRAAEQVHVEEQQRATRRFQKLAAIAALIACGALALGAWALRERNEAEFQSGVADKKTQLAERQTRIAEARRLDAFSDNAARNGLQPLSVLLAVEACGATQRVDGEPTANSRQCLLEALEGLGSTPLLGPPGDVSCLAISPNGRWLAAGSSLGGIVSDLKAVELAPRVLAGQSAPIRHLAFTADSRWLATVSEDLTLHVWDLNDMTPEQLPQPRVIAGEGGKLTALGVGGVALATGCDDGSVRVWNLELPDPSAFARRLTGHAAKITSAALSADGLLLATGSADGDVRLWDLSVADADRTVRELDRHPEGISGVALSADGGRLITAWGKVARVWRLTSGGRPAGGVPIEHEQAISVISISADGRWLATGCNEELARVWDLESSDSDRDSPLKVKTPGQTIQALVLSADGHWLATGGISHRTRIWPIQWASMEPSARRAVGRNLTETEWTENFPGQPYRKTFDDLPGEP